MPLYRVKNGKSFFYTRIYGAGEQVDYPGPAGTALELEDGEEPWPSEFQRGCGPDAAGGSAPQGADAPADLTDRLNRARSQMPDVVMRSDEPETLADLQAQDRARVDAADDKLAGDVGLTKAEIIADLEGMGIEFDARHSRVKLLEQRDAARAARA